MGEPIQKTVALDVTTDDLAVPFALITGRDAYAQRLKNRFRFFLGEWFLDQRQGVPYYQRVLGKPIDERVVRTVLIQVIESCPGTNRIERIDFDFDGKTRRLTIDNLEVSTTDGTRFVAYKDEFIITLPIAQE